MKIGIKKDCGMDFAGDEYTVDLDRRKDDWQVGAIEIDGCPFGVDQQLPLWLTLAIQTDGMVAFRGWTWNSGVCNNSYFHTAQHLVADGHRADNDPQEPFPGWDAIGSGRDPRKPWDQNSVRPTQAQIDTVNGLWSGRLRWEGLKIAIGGSVQHICPIEIEAEEARTGDKIYLA